MTGSYEAEVEQALNLTTHTPPTGQHAITEALGAAVRDHERHRISQRITAWAEDEGLTEEQWDVIYQVRALIHRG